MMQRTYELEQFKDFTLTFEDGTTQNVGYKSVCIKRTNCRQYTLSTDL